MRKLEEIEAAATAATPGPLRVIRCSPHDPLKSYDPQADEACGLQSPGYLAEHPEHSDFGDIMHSDSNEECSHPLRRADADFFATARGDVLDLVARVKELTATISGTAWATVSSDGSAIAVSQPFFDMLVAGGLLYPSQRSQDGGAFFFCGKRVIIWKET